MEPFESMEKAAQAFGEFLEQVADGLTKLAETIEELCDDDECKKGH